MGEIVYHNKQKPDITVTAEERADFLLKNGYPVPTEDRDTLIDMIEQKMKEEAEKKNG